MSYIQEVDITDSIKKGFTDLQDYLDRADLELNAFARTKGVMNPDDICVDPLDEVVRRYLVAWVTAMLCLEKSGQNDNNIGLAEKYIFKYDIYNKQAKEWKADITPEMLAGNVTKASSTAPTTGIIWNI